MSHFRFGTSNPLEHSLNFVESMAKYGKIEGVIGETTLFRSAKKRPRVLLIACFRADHYTLVQERGLKWQCWIGQSARPLKAYLAR